MSVIEIYVSLIRSSAGGSQANIFEGISSRDRLESDILCYANISLRGINIYLQRVSDMSRTTVRGTQGLRGVRGVQNRTACEERRVQLLHARH